MQIAIVGLIGVIGVLAMLLLSRVALRPLARLLSSTRRIAAGDYGERVEISAVSDLEQLAGAFNEMATAVETDIAARAEAEHEAVAAREAAERASQAKSRFLAAMTHELRTPMIGVTGMLEILAHTELTRHQRSMIATAEGSARSLLQIIGDVLDFSKIEADKLELAPASFDRAPSWARPPTRSCTPPPRAACCSPGTSTNRSPARTSAIRCASARSSRTSSPTP